MFYSKLLKIKNNIHLSQLSLIGGGLVLLMLSPSAAALDCTYTSSVNSHASSYSITLEKNEYEIAVFDTNINCRSYSLTSIIDFEFTSDTLSIPNSPDIYPTNLRGVGIKFILNHVGNTNCKQGISGQVTSPNMLDFHCDFNSHSNSSFTIRRRDTALLVKLDDNYEVGTIDIPSILKMSYINRSYHSPQHKTLGYIFQSPNLFTIKRNSCTLDSTTLNLNLGKNQQSDFKRIGTTGTPITKQIALTCRPDTHYFLQVDGNGEPSHQGVIRLTPEPGAATGVGVQLLAKGQPVQLNSAIQMGTSAASGNNIKETIDITAQYYQTENTVTPGPANASATFAMTYH